MWSGLHSISTQTLEMRMIVYAIIPSTQSPEQISWLLGAYQSESAMNKRIRKVGKDSSNIYLKLAYITLEKSIQENF